MNMRKKAYSFDDDDREEIEVCSPEFGRPGTGEGNRNSKSGGSQGDQTSITSSDEEAVMLEFLRK